LLGWRTFWPNFCFRDGVLHAAAQSDFQAP
jgi:hypothetical protein